MKKIWIFLLFFLLPSGLSFARQEKNNIKGEMFTLSINGEYMTIEGLQLVKIKKPYKLELPKPNQHDYIITHTGYTLSYNPIYHIADWVAYELTDDETTAVVKRNNHFVPDPLLQCCIISNSDYKNSGYDRGHLAPAGDMSYSYQTMMESFYLSNMAPQTPSFNRGIWKRLEEQIRQWAVDDSVVYIVTGTILKKGLKTIGPNKITVPSYFYKVILDYSENNVKGIGFIMPNEGSKEPLQNYAVTIDSVENLTGTDFFYQIPDDQEKIIESKIDLHKWSWKTSNKVKNTSNSRVSPVRCSSTIKKGTQCTRMTYSPNGKCWQYGGD